MRDAELQLAAADDRQVLALVENLFWQALDLAVARTGLAIPLRLIRTISKIDMRQVSMVSMALAIMYDAVIALDASIALDAAIAFDGSLAAERALAGNPMTVATFPQLQGPSIGEPMEIAAEDPYLLSQGATVKIVAGITGTGNDGLERIDKLWGSVPDFLIYDALQLFEPIVFDVTQLLNFITTDVMQFPEELPPEELPWSEIIKRLLRASPQIIKKLKSSFPSDTRRRTMEVSLKDCVYGRAVKSAMASGNLERLQGKTVLVDGINYGNVAAHQCLFSMQEVEQLVISGANVALGKIKRWWPPNPPPSRWQSFLSWFGWSSPPLDAESVRIQNELLWDIDAKRVLSPDDVASFLDDSASLLEGYGGRASLRGKVVLTCGVVSDAASVTSGKLSEEHARLLIEAGAVVLCMTVEELIKQAPFKYTMWFENMQKAIETIRQFSQIFSINFSQKCVAMSMWKIIWILTNKKFSLMAIDYDAGPHHPTMDDIRESTRSGFDVYLRTHKPRPFPRDWTITEVWNEWLKEEPEQEIFIRFVKPPPSLR
jgi:hypothetical protein